MPTNAESIYRARYRDKHLDARTATTKSERHRMRKRGEFPPGRLIAPAQRIWTEEEIAQWELERFERFNPKSDQAA